MGRARSPSRMREDPKDNRPLVETTGTLEAVNARADHHMSTVGELLRRTGRDEVIATVERLRGENLQARAAYQRIWLQLLAMRPKPTKTKCVLSLTEDAKPYVDVSGRTDGNPEKFAIEFEPWAEWLDMVVEVEPPLVLTETEIVAHVLREMTIAGYDEADIQSFYEELLRRMSTPWPSDPTD
jgi:hypothetical protein